MLFNKVGFTFPTYTLTASNFHPVWKNLLNFDIYLKSTNKEVFRFANAQLVLNVDSNYFNHGHILAYIETNAYVENHPINVERNQIRIFMFTLDTTHYHISSEGLGTKLCTVRLSTDKGGFIGNLNPMWNNQYTPTTGIGAFEADTIADITDTNFHYISGPTVIGSTSGIINTFELFQNYPNPFNPTTIGYNLAKLSNVSLEVFDIQGRLIEKDFIGTETEGYHKTQWRSILSSGTFFYRLQIMPLGNVGNTTYTPTKKMILLK